MVRRGNGKSACGGRGDRAGRWHDLAVGATIGRWSASLGASAASSPDSSAAALSRWTGGIDLYRSGVFTTQKTWLWCTAADVQIIRNIVTGRADHSRSSQARYFDYMRAHNRYHIPVSDGVDPAGWTAGLRHFVDSRYRLYASTSFDSALRSAVTNLRKTNLPVGITVSHGNHAWVLTGFTATADPAVTTRFKVTSVRVVGPLYGLKSRSYGYDMRPDTKLTPAQLKGFFTPWHYTSVPMAWENRWVSIQPVTAPDPPARTATAAPTPRPTPRPSPAAEPSAPSEPSPTAAPTTALVANAVGPVGTAGPPGDIPTAPEPSPTAAELAIGVLGGLAVLIGATIAGAALTRRTRRTR